MSANQSDPSTPLERAVADLAGAFDWYVAGDVATKLNCGELDALVEVFRVAGHDKLADVWLECHADGDEEGDAHFGMEFPDGVLA